MTKVYVYPADRGGCGHSRMIYPAEALRHEGYDVTIRGAGEATGFLVEILMDCQVILKEVPDCDVVVIQRPAHWTRKHIIPQLQAKGIRVVGEIDDDMRSLDPQHVAYGSSHPRWSPKHNYVHCAEALAACDRVTVTTPVLRDRYGRNTDCLILPNMVPSRHVLKEPRIHEDKPPENVTVGWAGRTATHPNDLEATKQGVGRAQRELGFKFMVIGEGEWVRRGLGLGSDPYVYRWCPIGEYPGALSHLDVGIAPLAPSAFNESKSDLKPLEYAARGVPFICSESGPYKGFLTSSPKPPGVIAWDRSSWTDACRRLVRDADLRTELAARGLETARQRTVERNLDQWVKAWWL